VAKAEPPRPAPPPARAAAPAPAPAPAPQPAPEPRVATVRYTPPPALGRAPAAAPAAASAEPTLDDSTVDAAFAKHKPAFEACIAAARQGEPNVTLGGRTVNVTMTVNPDGKAAYPTLDDVELNGTGLGECLKRESGKIRFPSFGGDSIRVTKPIVLR
jgi:hypothetical protein